MDLLKTLLGWGSPFLPIAAHQVKGYSQSLSKCKKHLLCLRCMRACQRQLVLKKRMSSPAKSQIAIMDWQLKEQHMLSHSTMTSISWVTTVSISRVNLEILHWDRMAALEPGIRFEVNCLKTSFLISLPPIMCKVVDVFTELRKIDAQWLLCICLP